jgi:cytochrome c biogenesis protein CcmG/thiol:disulfide interchange protein DsbE
VVRVRRGAVAASLASILLVPAPSGVASGAVGGGLKPGSPAPGFSLTDITGRRLDLASYRGKVVLLDFWATWCGPCRKEIPRFVEMQEEYGPRGLQILGISLDDSAEPVRGFYRELKMNYPVALGDAALAEKYGGVLGLPTAFLIGRDGRIRASHVGEADLTLIEKEIVELLDASNPPP